MRIVVFGLGYVGCVSATCLADMGHDVVGVDVSEAKVAQVRAGTPPLSEPGLGERLGRTVTAGRLRATTDPADALPGAEVVLICVGTPSAANGSLDYRQLFHVADQISEHLGAAAARPVIAVRSTVLGDTVLREILPRLEGGRRRAGDDFGLCVNPEFLREGSAVRDFFEPPMTLIGAMDEDTSAKLACVYSQLTAPVVRVDVTTASLIKYASNAYHALKIVFANEIGVLCENIGADSHAVMDIFCRDTKLNVSRAYLKPGFAFGGSCLPKDLRAMLHRARHADADLPVLSAIMSSNELHIQRAVNAVAQSGRRRIGFVGLSFKPQTDDLRESPLVAVVEQLIGRGFDVCVYDADVTMSRVFGRNRDYIDRTIPHITSLMVDSLEALIAESELIVVGKPVDGLEEALIGAPRPDQMLLDLCRVWQASAHDVHGRPVTRLN